MFFRGTSQQATRALQEIYPTRPTVVGATTTILVDEGCSEFEERRTERETECERETNAIRIEG